MRTFDFTLLKSCIAHEWGHYLALHLLGYGKWNEGIEIEVNPLGFFGHTINYCWVYGIQPSCEEHLIILYSGPIAEGLFSGRKVRLCYTDNERAKTIAPDNRVRQMARKKAENLITPYSKVIATLVSLTIQRDGYGEEMNLLSFYDWISKDEASQYLEMALSSIDAMKNKSVTH